MRGTRAVSFVLPVSARRYLPGLLSASFAALACSGGDAVTESPATNVDETTTSSPADEPTDVPTDMVAVVPVSSEQPPALQASYPYDADDEAAPDQARSVVDVWQLDNRSMSARFVHFHEPPRGEGLPALVTLIYFARDSAGRSVQLEWPYAGEAVSYSYDNLSVAPSYVAFRDENAQREWVAAAGNVTLVPLANSRVRVELAGLEIREWVGIEMSPPEPIADGFVEGDVERICAEYDEAATKDAPIDSSTGLPFPQMRRDEDWSSPFCAQFAR